MNAPTNGSRVVPPPPSVQGAGSINQNARSGSLAGTSAQAVAPPPSVQSAGSVARAGHALPGAGPNVVSPPPSVQAAARGVRSGSMAGAGSEVIPPPPSLQNAADSGRGSRSLAGAGSNIAPPPPSIQGTAGNARGGSMAGAQAVPPPPSVQGSAGAVGGTRLDPLSGTGPEAAAPPASVASAGNSGVGGVLQPMDPLPADDSLSSSDANSDNKSTFEELPLGLIGVVFAAPGTSYFSNFEVFVAKRRVRDKNSDQLQLIKLVYEFLPYQRRLSEYDLNNQPARVVKLRVTPDPSCDESLGQMILSHTDATTPAAEYSKLPAALRSSDLSAVLPCYRTTAGDFQKAMSRGR